MSATTNSPRVMMRFGEMSAWLGGYGIAKDEIERCIAKGLIKSYSLAGSWNYYNREQIERDLFPLLDLKPTRTTTTKETTT